MRTATLHAELVGGDSGSGNTYTLVRRGHETTQNKISGVARAASLRDHEHAAANGDVVVNRPAQPTDLVTATLRSGR